MASGFRSRKKNRALDAAAVVGVYVLGWVLRMRLRHAPYYGDEGLLFYLSRHLTRAPTNVHDLYFDGWAYVAHVVYQRPVYYLTYWPAAQVSFDAFRLFHIALASTLPVLILLLLRAKKVRLPFALGAGVAAATLPAFVTWGAVGLMDTYGVVLFVGGLWLRAARRPATGALVMLLSIGAKEIAWFGVLFVLGLSLLEARRQGRSLLPARLDRFETVLLYGLPFAFLPLMLSMAGGVVPGGHVDRHYPAALLDGLFITPWLLAPIALGLVWRRTRESALAGLFFPAFFLAGHLALDRAVEAWYAILPQSLVLVAVGMAADEACTRAGRAGAWSLRVAPMVAASGLAALLLASPVAVSSPLKTDVLHPLFKEPVPDLAKVVRDGNGRDPDFWDAVSVVDHDRRPVFLVDVSTQTFLYPLAESGRPIVAGSTVWTTLAHLPMTPWNRTIETNGGWTLLVRIDDNALNRAVRLVYADCIVRENRIFVVLDGARCQGRGASLATAAGGST